MSGQNYGYGDETWGQDASYQNGAGYDGSGENYQLQEQNAYGQEGADGDGGGGYAAAGAEALPPPVHAAPNSATSMFRSEEMALCQLFLQSEAAYACVSELGELGLVQFRDLNPDTNAFQRKFVNEVRRCSEMERKLRFLETEIKKDDIPMMDSPEATEAPQPREMIDLEATFEKLEHELQEVNQNAEQLKRNYLELTELKHILRKTQQFFEEQDQLDPSTVGQHQQLIQEDPSGAPGGAGGGLQLGFVAGVILRERLPAFERMLWRACRGNVFLRQAEIEDPLEDPQSNGQVLKSVFVIFFQGEQLKSRVKKICEGFRSTLYPCPDQAADRREMAVGVMQRLEDLNTVLGQTNDHRHRVLVAAAKNIRVWFVKVRKIMAIYHTLNMFNLDVTQKCLIAECWIPTLDIEAIQFALRRGTEKSGSSVAPILNQMVTKESPPTFFRTNKFTVSFQALVNAYGVASYQEINPAVYTIITFPFLFGVMFGDLGHGLILMGFGVWMCMKEKQLEARKIENEIWKIFFSGRYIIALMSFFSIYSGLLYNDVFSKSINIFGSSWNVYQSRDEIMQEEKQMLDPADKRGYYGTPYMLGVDPIWQLAENKITFLNSLKMKLSVILGVSQMLFGVILSYKNSKYFQRPLNVLTEFIPQLIFLVCMFVYLCLLMFHKWSSYSAVNNRDPEGYAASERCAPAILITFINMILMKDNSPAAPGCDPYMFWGERNIQRLLLLVSLACVPVMLFAKPYFLRKAHLQRQAQSRMDVNGGQNVDASATATSSEPEAFQMSDVLVLQGIHTIEYVLESVSHTASYLRLWALSLAHAQLSEVLWSMVLRLGLSVDGWYGGVFLWAIFGIWSFLTVGLLCLMEGLSAFLHTLRLHWVEFQSKFYKGDGYIFVPFCFETLIKQAEERAD